MQNRKFGEPERDTGAMAREDSAAIHTPAPAGKREAGSYPSPSFLNALND
jgi:hypothetical protein